MKIISQFHKKPKTRLHFLYAKYNDFYFRGEIMTQICLVGFCEINPDDYQIQHIFDIFNQHMFGEDSSLYLK